MSNQSQTMSNEEIQASNAVLKAQVEYLAKQVAQRTKMKMTMLDTPEESDEELDEGVQATGNSSNITNGSSCDKGTSDFKNSGQEEGCFLWGNGLEIYGVDEGVLLGILIGRKE
ncbi:unnamed protein product [Cuscuta campestris]|uniref:Uncharacterized protein n=1 Tax=Cuscuta campestris TaxID=132261 RepID=A0A484LP48_9ASTE|nr:unnamed protein product [Cuscuta campestris]